MKVIIFVLLVASCVVSLQTRVVLMPDYADDIIDLLFNAFVGPSSTESPAVSDRYGRDGYDQSPGDESSEETSFSTARALTLPSDNVRMRDGHCYDGQGKLKRVDDWRAEFKNCYTSINDDPAIDEEELFGYVGHEPPTVFAYLYRLRRCIEVRVTTVMKACFNREMEHFDKTVSDRFVIFAEKNIMPCLMTNRANVIKCRHDVKSHLDSSKECSNSSDVIQRLEDCLTNNYTNCLGKNGNAVVSILKKILVVWEQEQRNERCNAAGSVLGDIWTIGIGLYIGVGRLLF